MTIRFAPGNRRRTRHLPGTPADPLTLAEQSTACAALRERHALPPRETGETCDDCPLCSGTCEIGG